MLTDPQAAAFERKLILGQLGESFASLRWAVRLVPDGWSHRSPYGGRVSQEEGAWSVAMNLAHLVLYEERLPRGVLESLLAGGNGVADTWFKEPSPYEEPAVQLAAEPLNQILHRLEAARANTLSLAGRFTDAEWTSPVTGAWGRNGYGPNLWSPARVLAKSFQHTWEHGNSIFRVSLFAPRELAEG